MEYSLGDIIYGVLPDIYVSIFESPMFIRTADRQQGNSHSPMADPTGGGGSAAQPVSTASSACFGKARYVAERRSYGTTGRCWERETQADLRDLEACT